tara:strand:+ start:991 stop:3135 length:2145 start_codon:yes stop_codon:yes gene_type:complete
MPLEGKPPEGDGSEGSEPTESPQPTQPHPEDKELKALKKDLQGARHAVAIASAWERHDKSKVSTERPRLWQDSRARPIVEFVWPNVVTDSGAHDVFSGASPILTADWRVMNVGPVATSVVWRDSLGPPYSTIKIEARSGGTLFGDIELPDFLYCRIRVPDSSPVDPGRVLACGYNDTYTQTSSATQSGAVDQAETWTFIGWYDLCGRAEVYGDMGLVTGSGRGTLIPWMEYENILTGVESVTEETKMLGPGLEYMWRAAYKDKRAKVKVARSSTKGKVHQDYNIEGVARLVWPTMLLQGGGSGDSGGMEGLYSLVKIVHDHRDPPIDSGGTAALSHAGLNCPFVPGMTGGAALKTMQAGGSLASLLAGTFLCDRSMVELFPTILYSHAGGKAKNVLALVYRMKPFRLTKGGNWIQLSQKTAAYAAKARALADKHNVKVRSSSTVYIDAIHDASSKDKGIAAWKSAGNRTRSLNKLLGRIRKSYQRATDAAFGGDSWPKARSMAVDCARDMIFSFQLRFADTEQVNVVCGGQYNTPDHYNMFSNFAGVPIMGRDKVWIQGARVFRPTWPHQIADSGTKGMNSRDRSLLNDSMTVRALAVEAAQTVLDQAFLASGSVTCVWNPDIRPGRVVRFRGVVGEYNVGTETTVSLNGRDTAQQSRSNTVGSINYAYVEDVTHTYDVDVTSGALKLRTSFTFSHHVADESQRMNLMHHDVSV